MKVTYKGKHEQWSETQQSKLDAKFAKLSKMLEQKGEKEAHVVLTQERYIHHAEVQLNFYDHPLVGLGSDADNFSALTIAVDKLEKQAMKVVAKRREGYRGSKEELNGEEPVDVEAVENTPVNGKAAGKKIYRVNYDNGSKPMTLEEALLDIEKEVDYVVYRDAGKDCVSVLVRRRDGHYDLIEGD